jgi:hypothetical protein
MACGHMALTVLIVKTHSKVYIRVDTKKSVDRESGNTQFVLFGLIEDTLLVCHIFHFARMFL